MGKTPGLYSDIGKRARDLLNKDYQADQKFTTYSPTGITLTSTGTKKGELFLADINTQLKHKNITTDVKVDTASNQDEDFVADKDDGGSPTDDSGVGESDGSDSGEEKEVPMKKKLKKEPSFKASSSRKNTKDGDENGSKKNKQKKKKDPNAPKRAISAFMFFSQTERENVKKNNPGISFTEVGKELRDRWNKLTAEEKAPYEAKARADKIRYSDEIKGYKNPQASNLGLADEYDNE